MQHAKRWLGVESRPVALPEEPMATTQVRSATEKVEVSSAGISVNENAESIWRAHAAIDRVYGTGYAKENPSVVAQFMLVFATQKQADELAALREIISAGSGGITVGIER